MVDSETGLVLKSKAKKVDYSLEDALHREKTKKDKVDDLFAKVLEDEKRRHSSLEEKFRKALDSKDELDDPKRPLGFD